MLWRFAILVLKALATLSRVILRIFSWKSEFIMFLTCSPSKSYLGLFGAGVFGFGSSWSVFSRNCIILLASNITRSFSGTKSMNWKFNITVIDKKTGPKVVCYHPKSIVPEVGNYHFIPFILYLLHASWKRQMIFSVSYLLGFLVLNLDTLIQMKIQLI